MKFFTWAVLCNRDAKDQEQMVSINEEGNNELLATREVSLRRKMYASERERSRRSSRPYRVSENTNRLKFNGKERKGHE